MARKPRKGRPVTGLKHARLSRDLSQADLAERAGVAKNTVIRLENGDPRQGGMKLTREWAERFAGILGYTAEDILFWDMRGKGRHIESSEVAASAAAPAPAIKSAQLIPELVARGGMGGGGFAEGETRFDGHYADPVKPEGWLFPATFMQNELRAPSTSVLIIESEGDSMFPTIASGERVIINTRHREPSPDGLYALRDTFGAIVIKRLQVVRASDPRRIRIISDNPNHIGEEVPLGDVEIVGRVWGSLRRL